VAGERGAVAGATAGAVATRKAAEREAAVALRIVEAAAVDGERAVEVAVGGAADAAPGLPRLRLGATVVEEVERTWRGGGGRPRSLVTLAKLPSLWGRGSHVVVAWLSTRVLRPFLVSLLLPRPCKSFGVAHRLQSQARRGDECPVCGLCGRWPSACGGDGLAPLRPRLSTLPSQRA
jgi:hypothetical protein